MLEVSRSSYSTVIIIEGRTAGTLPQLRNVGQLQLFRVHLQGAGHHQGEGLLLQQRRPERDRGEQVCKHREFIEFYRKTSSPSYSMPYFPQYDKKRQHMYSTM